ncbi:hypothetical protein [Rhodococcus sp. IEGM 1408]|uniref:hypothetical protein n=1 Tax=Rhodococcus sp. IEGM 1408 TaxID=3082220 RepID=UPI002955BACC|nr:hypothetical protein [Rhodococcus sp. IEGM 1408]MDV8002074.1 hypothetical protein [Rhodococcus sp. IEGM 1408]
MTVSLELLSRGPSRPDLFEDLVVSGSGLAATLSRWSVPVPVDVAPDPDTGLPGLDAVAEVLAAGTAAVVDVAPGLAGPGPAADWLVDLLAVAAHSGVGFGSGLAPRCTDAGQIWALLAGAVAAMTGGDVRAALASPDPAALVALPRSAREAIRDVVTCAVVPAGVEEEVAADLASAGRS